MNPGLDYKKEIRRATIGIVASAIVLMLAFSVALSALFFYLDAVAEAAIAQKREGPFDPWEDSGRQDSYRTWRVLGLTDEFASDFKDTYHYHFAFDTDKYVVIVRMKGELGEEFTPYVNYVYEEEAESPEPLTIRGVAAPIPEDIREFAIESMNLLYDSEFMTQENFEDYLGICLLDMSKKPVGRANFKAARILAIAGAAMGAAALFILLVRIRERRNIGLAEQREQEQMRDLEAMNRRFLEGEFRYEDGMGADEPGAGAGRGWGGIEGVTEETLSRQQKKSRVFPGILGALVGSLLGAAVWVAVGMVGFLTGIAGLAIMGGAAAGYERLSGRLDKKGMGICLVITVIQVFLANLATYGVILCRAFFKWEASMDTVRYVAGNFWQLMTEMECWGRFGFDLVMGYLLSIWTCFRVIKGISGRERKRRDVGDRKR